MGLYDAFRSYGGPTHYADNKTPWKADLIESGIIFCISILAFSFFIILPGIRGKQKYCTLLRISISLFIGAVILVTNFAMTWEYSKINTYTKYKAGTGMEIKADVGVYIGLRGINITLKGTPEKQLNETINYNEHFSWVWRQGRLGFGPFAGRYNQEFRAAQFRGLPLPILWIAEYFTFDGEGIRWGRNYRQAGWYTHILLWLSFPLWVLSNILLILLLRYGAYLMMLTGVTMILSNILFCSIRNVNNLVIPFTSENVLHFSYGEAFWTCLGVGIICFFLGLLILFMDTRHPVLIAVFFGVDVLQDSEEIEVIEPRKKTGTPMSSEKMNLTAVSQDVESGNLHENLAAADAVEDSDEIYTNMEGNDFGAAQKTDDKDVDDEDFYQVQYKSRTAKLTKRFQKARRIPSTQMLPQKWEDEDEENDYENVR